MTIQRMARQGFAMARTRGAPLKWCWMGGWAARPRVLGKTRRQKTPWTDRG